MHLSTAKHQQKNLFYLLLIQLRPRQWTKNVLILAALIFSINQVNVNMFYKSILAFFLFSIVSSCVYIVNDFMDREADSNHPTKRFRPMASGALNPFLAISVGLILLLVSLSTSYFLNIRFGLILSLYFIINIAYSIKLKHVVIIDVMIVASGFVLRSIGGGFVIGVHLTPWFLICTMLLSLFLAISKRRHEFIIAQENKYVHRKVLKFYNKELLDQMNSIVTTTTIISYALFTFTSGRTIYLMWTIPFVIYGIFRYLYLIHVEGKGGSPDKLLFEDKSILVAIFFYAIVVITILYLFE
ncbi:decaprenyl-phosphate phosphoribosyltransferase [Paenibacillus sp. LMG 31460]|uniref:Decaprenyl-phosphate phosphoribosyltransferase n=1 Tax=Paenibacillus germinis TaxID=2654979 RepID=A0ABX1Z6Q4_9BACL|nr:decaprenyl-phosphate phosphoribosyltransferase [Paenibacillus germinis]NOU87921.1 decaprenyl-phosphate phosphoribosyltransferase [Paenibacillus germinis]